MVGVVAAGAFLFTPLIPVVATGFALYGPVMGCMVGTGVSVTASGVAIKNAVDTSRELVSREGRCPKSKYPRPAKLHRPNLSLLLFGLADCLMP